MYKLLTIIYFFFVNSPLYAFLIQWETKQNDRQMRTFKQLKCHLNITDKKLIEVQKKAESTLNPLKPEETINLNILELAKEGGLGKYFDKFGADFLDILPNCKNKNIEMNQDFVKGLITTMAAVDSTALKRDFEKKKELLIADPTCYDLIRKFDISRDEKNLALGKPYIVHNKNFTRSILTAPFLVLLADDLVKKIQINPNELTNTLETEEKKMVWNLCRKSEAPEAESQVNDAKQDLGKLDLLLRNKYGNNINNAEYLEKKEIIKNRIEYKYLDDYCGRNSNEEGSKTEGYRSQIENQSLISGTDENKKLNELRKKFQSKIANISKIWQKFLEKTKESNESVFAVISGNTNSNETSYCIYSPPIKSRTNNEDQLERDYGIISRRYVSRPDEILAYEVMFLNSLYGQNEGVIENRTVALFKADYLYLSSRMFFAHTSDENIDRNSDRDCKLEFQNSMHKPGQ